jgi:hypothetical protein
MLAAAPAVATPGGSLANATVPTLASYATEAAAANAEAAAPSAWGLRAEDALRTYIITARDSDDDDDFYDASEMLVCSA